MQPSSIPSWDAQYASHGYAAASAAEDSGYDVLIPQGSYNSIAASAAALSQGQLAQHQLSMQKHFTQPGNCMSGDNLTATHVAAQAAVMASSATAVAAAAAAAAAALTNHHSIDLMAPAATHLQCQQHLQQQQQQLLSFTQGCSRHNGWLSSPLPEGTIPVSDCSLPQLPRQQLQAPQQQADLQQCGLYLLDDVPMSLPQLAPITQLQDVRPSLAAPPSHLSGCYSTPGRYSTPGLTGCSSMAAALPVSTPNDALELPTDMASYTAPDVDSCGCFATVSCTGLHPCSRRSLNVLSCQSSLGGASHRTSLEGFSSRNNSVAGQCFSRPLYSRSNSSISSAGAGPAAPTSRTSSTTIYHAAVPVAPQPVNSHNLAPLPAPVEVAAAGPAFAVGGWPSHEHLPPQQEGVVADPTKGLSGDRGLVQSAAPKWAGKFWHPMAEVVKTGQMSNKGTGVFIPGGPKSASP
eukprot:gene6895-7111_t